MAAFHPQPIELRNTVSFSTTVMQCGSYPGSSDLYTGEAASHGTRVSSERYLWALEPASLIREDGSVS